jgi:hypothetical protein
MILWEIFKAMNTGLVSGRETIYNIFQGKQYYKEGVIMKTMAEERMEVCSGHPERQQIFHLEKMLLEAGYPYYFNFWEELRPTPFRQEGGDPEKDIDWEHYNFLIEVGRQAGYGYSQISVCFDKSGDGTLLELLDMRPAEGKKNPTAEDGELHSGLTSEQAMEIIEKFFEMA